MNLKGKRFLNTRPQHQANALTNSIETEGGSVIPFPAIEIQALHPALPTLPSDLTVIVTSRNAVSQTLKTLLPHTVTWIAIGPATKQALIDFGVTDNIIQPNVFNSSGLLQLPELQFINQKSIWIFTGENSKPQLHTTLQKRGAVVEMIYCYRRIKPTINSQQVMASLTQTHIDAIISTSLQGLHNLFELLEPQWLCNQTWLVISNDMAAACHRLGIQKTWVAKNPTDTEIVNCLLHHSKA